jgi:tetratricopeptide (TPR) repeat protein
MTGEKRLLGLVLAGVVLVSAAFWARRQWDPGRFRSFPVSRLERWIADHPDDADALYELGRRYVAAGQVTDARQALERAARLEPGNARLLNDLGELDAAQGNYLAAQALFEQAVHLRPELPEPHRNLGDLAGIARNYALAIQHYRQALALDPKDVKALTSLGSACADAMNRGEADTAFRKAIALAPTSPGPYQQWGLALYKLRDYVGAREALQQALERDPNDAYTHLYLGLVYARQLGVAADEQQAFLEFDRAIALGYSGGEADYGRGLVYLRRKEYAPAIAALDAAVRREGGGEDARYQLVRACFAAGQTARGRAVLRQFQRFKETETEIRRLHYQLALQPGATALRRRLARLCVDTGRYREALQQCQLLSNAGAADAEVFQGMARAAAAVGDTRLADQARASLLRVGSSGLPARH